MSMTTSDAIAFIRSLIKESTAIFWQDTEITLYLNVALQSLWSKYASFLYEMKKDWEGISLSSGVADYDKPTNSFKIAKILITETGSKLPYVFDDELFKWTDAVPPDATNYLTCFYLPKYADITSFPDSMQPLACVEAIMFAKAKDEAMDQYILDLRAWYEDAVKFDMASHNLSDVSAFPDFAEEESLSSEYAWCYKGEKIHLLETQNA